jgi:ABC-type branched-subunit amino acid transport system substrate-binding protein
VNIFPGTADGASARFARANREGGIDGRKINYLGISDDGADSTRALQLTRELVVQKKVMAMVPVMSAGFIPSVSQLALDNQVPFVGWGFEPGFCYNDYGFGFDGCSAGKSVPLFILTAIAQALGKNPKDLRYAALAANSIPSQAGITYSKQVAAYLGVNLVYAQATVPADQPSVNYAPYVQALLAAKPDVIQLYITFQGDTAMIAALHAAGYKGPIVSNTTYVPGILQSQPSVAAALEDSWAISPISPAEGGSEQVKQVAADMTAAGLKPDVTIGAQIGWDSADLFIQMAKQSHAKTGAELAASINQGFTYKPLAGGVPVAFPNGHKELSPCASVVHIVHGMYVQVLPLTCGELLPGT